jgi:hypothetical protein
VSFSTGDPSNPTFSFEVSGVVTAPAPVATVNYNGTSIADGSSTTSTTNGTNLGTAAVGAAPLSATFTIVNAGNASLTISNMTMPTGFTLFGAPASSVAAGGSTTFTVVLETSSPGTFSGNISFNTNDPNNDPFTFAITGVIILETTWTGSQSNSWSNPGNWSSGAVPGSATTAIINSGTVIASSPFTIGGLVITGGILRLGIDSTSGTYTMSSLSITGGGTLDVGNNKVMVNYGNNTDPKSAILSDLASGYNNGSWNGPGIDSSAAIAIGNGAYGVGYADGADGIDTSLTSGQLEIAYAQYGDISLQGLVNAGDFHILASDFGQVVTSGWEGGDLTYQGVVNAQDFHLLASNFGRTASYAVPGLTLGAGAQFAITGSPGAQVLNVLSGTVTLNKDMSGLFANYTLEIQSGARVVLASNQHVGALELIGNGTLDVSTYSLTIDYGSGVDPKTTILQYLANGANNGAWNGTGIVSSAAAGNSNYGVGFADGADGIDPSLTSGQIEIAYAQYGDITLQGLVNAQDFHILAGNFGQVVTGGWEDGDFLYQGVVNAQDFHLLAQNFGQTATGENVTLAQSVASTPAATAGSEAIDTTSILTNPVSVSTQVPAPDTVLEGAPVIPSKMDNSPAKKRKALTPVHPVATVTASATSMNPDSKAKDPDAKFLAER